jgi:hypothetical protein
VPACQRRATSARPTQSRPPAVLQCPRARPHDWTACPFAHPVSWMVAADALARDGAAVRNCCGKQSFKRLGCRPTFPPLHPAAVCRARRQSVGTRGGTVTAVQPAPISARWAPAAPVRRCQPGWRPWLLRDCRSLSPLAAAWALPSLHTSSSCAFPECRLESAAAATRAPTRTACLSAGCTPAATARRCAPLPPHAPCLLDQPPP